MTLALLVSTACGGAGPVVSTPAKPAAKTEPETSKHCREILWQRDLPRCLEEVSPSARARMVEGRILTYRGDRLVRSALVNGEGFPVEERGTATEEFVYDGTRLSELRQYDRFGKLKNKNLSSADGKRKTMVDPWGRPYRDGEVSILERDFDSKGFIVRLRCFDADDKPTLNEGGVHEMRWERGADGQIVAETGFDQRGQPTTYYDGFHRLERKADARGNVLSWKYFDLAGKPVLTRNGIHAAHQTYDQYGNLLRVEWYGTQGEPVRHVMGNHAFDVTRDSNGRGREWLYLDIGGAPVVTTLGYASMLVSHNDHGWAKEVRYLDAEDRPVITKDGYARSVHSYDSKDREVEIRYFGVNDEPILVYGVNASVRFEYNARDLMTTKSLFGLDAELAQTPTWYAVWNGGYDSFDQLTEQAFFHSDGRAAEVRGFARMQTTYDARGKVSGRKFANAKGAPLQMMHFAEIVVRHAGASGAPRHIQRSLAEARKRIEEARDRMRQGLPFPAAVLTYSDDAVGRSRSYRGDAGYYAPSALLPGIRQALEKLEVDQVSDVIAESFGLVLVKRLALE